MSLCQVSNPSSYLTASYHAESGATNAFRDFNYFRWSDPSLTEIRHDWMLPVFRELGFYSSYRFLASACHVGTWPETANQRTLVANNWRVAIGCHLVTWWGTDKKWAQSEISFNLFNFYTISVNITWNAMPINVNDIRLIHIIWHPSIKV